MSTVLVAQYFLNHRLDLEEVRWQVRELARAGYQAIHPHARAGLLTPYMSEDWWRAMDVILEVCGETGMELWIWDEDYFPSGLAGGRVVWEDPGLIARGLEFTVAHVEAEGTCEVDFAPGHLLRAFAVPQEDDGNFGEPQDVTRFCGTRRQTWTERHLLHRAYSPLVDRVGHPHWRCEFVDNRFALAWTPPTPGQYVIVGVVVRGTSGVHPDILRPEGIRRFIELSHGAYHERYGTQFGTTIKAAFTDEPSPGGPLYPWTARFPQEFMRDHGYDLLPHLAHLALDIDDRSPAVRHHFRLTQHRLQRACYVEQIAQWCEQHQILMTGHLTRTEWLSLTAAWWPNELRCYQPMHIPACDPLGASCAWPDAAAYHTGVKVVSSAAHLFGRPQASSDALAVVGDEASLRDLKSMLDYQMVLGVNHFSVHGLSQSTDGPRKDEVPPSLFYQHTEWKHMRVLLDYVRQTCEALTGGKHVCGIAVLYPSTSLACQLRADDTWPNLPDEALVHELVEQLLSHQRDFDFIDEVTLCESMDERGGLRTPENYEVIILPHLRYLDARTADALARFAAAGGRVLAVGGVPQAITGDLSAPLRPIDRSTLPMELHPRLDDAVIATLPGLAVSGEGARDVFVLRRRVGQETRTFAFNRREAWFEGTVDGTPVAIPPRGSVFVERPPTVGERAVSVADLSAGWTVSFEPNQLPLSFWHVWPLEDGPPGNLFSGAGYDLMTRQQDPAGEGTGRVLYACRFMLTGAIPDARLVLEDSAVGGEWELRVNGAVIESTAWQKVLRFDCRNREADIAHALRGGTTPTLNVLTIESRGPGRGLREIPYLYGSFTCEFRYGHLSFPFVRGPASSEELGALQPWSALGRPTFSGSATYTRSVVVPDTGDYGLDLGRVEDVAAVRVDGESVAVLAWPPYRCVLPGLTAGRHMLEVEVSNPPANRKRAAGFPAGLLGPVRLLCPAS